MGFVGLVAFLLAASLVNSGWCHHHHRGVHVDNRKKGEQVKRYDENVILPEGGQDRTSLNFENPKGSIPFSERRLEKMLEKAILKIITGDLSTGDMLLLKSLNYTLDEILEIRERELGKKKEEESRKKESAKSWAKAHYGDGEKKSKYKDKNSMDRSASKKLVFGETKREGKKNRHADKSVYKDFDFEAYNRQAILDYENLPSNVEFQPSWSEAASFDYEETTKASKEQEVANNLHRDFDKAMEPHVVFKIRYDDSEFDSSSGSDETGKNRSKTSKHRVSSTMKHTTSKNHSDSFQTSTPATLSSTVTDANSLPVVYQLNNLNNVKGNYPNNVYSSTTSSSTPGTSSTTEKTVPEETTKKVLEEKTSVPVQTNDSRTEEKVVGNKKISEYEGLEWVEDDVYRVIPEFVDSLDFENTEGNETSDYEDSSHDSRPRWNTEDSENDTAEYQNDATDSVKLFMTNSNASINNLPLANLSTYLQAALDYRRGQGEKAIEDIKSRVLALTGRFNLTSNTNQVQRQRLTMFSPTCQIPRNTDQDAWTDPFSMNMHFQLNLTSGDHVVAAKLRIYKLPQENLTSSTESTLDEEEEDEKKIRISVYYYTKSLKRHRSKKRLMDSVVTPLTSRGTHLALDVRQGLRFWRLNPRNSHGNGSNHGLVVQVEDQDGRPLKPVLYIQQPSCADQDSDQKAYQRVPALFIRACARYVRIVNDKPETYVNCRY
ncbi:uncharacterized protein LOC100881679 isoform X2 [Megachile rotundata]|uniref:uncharacterized protein LOC100881679 isoform X2 n=1 Tax=Megachile rotundata TaxID=143995 RepID=UPI000614E4F8|nr:PREDICTED: uncharacterized protein LOC100881679 isoform X2 [Megachile rotundata]